MPSSRLRRPVGSGPSGPRGRDGDRRLDSRRGDPDSGCRLRGWVVRGFPRPCHVSGRLLCRYHVLSVPRSERGSHAVASQRKRGEARRRHAPRIRRRPGRRLGSVGGTGRQRQKRAQVRAERMADTSDERRPIVSRPACLHRLCLARRAVGGRRHDATARCHSARGSSGARSRAAGLEPVRPGFMRLGTLGRPPLCRQLGVDPGDMSPELALPRFAAHQPREVGLTGREDLPLPLHLRLPRCTRESS